ncbi:Rpn family recombination-promoting nuclease/putative transposase [Butyrivibrio sp. AE3003]|uniref:Rpn family recombination-promoting nuclease/putative transposase n=1 Tax=Butyrivibrio sp. AE3003 TaxID=1496721 RepID=UPI00047E1FE6|nr:Rpn family recombination-promoting nuclease/putative transposase [Butyrivibrio sp. AE3003]
MRHKEFKDLTFADDFMFAKVMLNEKLCKQLLEIILEVKIKKLSYPEEQKTINPSYDSKSVRLDVYVDDEKGTVYNIEMQTTNPGNIPRRARYYQGMIDLNLIEKGEDYHKLAKSYVIFICTEDIYELDKPVYRFENYCREYELPFGDDSYKVILNAACTELHDTELGNFLRFVRTGEPMDEFTDNLQNEVNVVKRNEKWEVEYMTLLMRDNEKKKEGRKEYQLLLRAIPKESDDFTLALTAEDDVIEALMEKYNIYSEE